MQTWSRRLISRLRTVIKGWSSEGDRSYFDAHFASQDFDPFTFSYPGYITIRRFADLVAPYLQGLTSALDVGCGPAEISCELARRFPEMTFLGVDHSQAAVERAQQNALSLNLGNISFQKEDAENLQLSQKYDIVLLFDSFHHLVKPRQFVESLQEDVSRFLLIEPRGDWKGSWRKDLDFDWIMMELEKLRARISDNLDENESILEPRLKKNLDCKDQPVENRYLLKDFQKFFSGFGLEVKGTVSGLDSYPPSPMLRSASRERFGKMAYALYKEIDDILYEKNLDLLSKHWIIFAEKGASHNLRPLPSKIQKKPSVETVQGPYDVQYAEYKGPNKVKCGETFEASLTIYNHSYRSWSSHETENPDFLSYHWLDRQYSIKVQDGKRSPLPQNLPPGEKCNIHVSILAPDRPGRYYLAFDMVRENVTWYSEAGSPCFHISFRIRS